MEKYSRWADLTTGINPFVPPTTRPGRSVAVAAVQWIGSLVLLILRLPLVLAALLLLVISSLLTTVTGVIPLLGRLIQRVLDWPLCALLLAVSGVVVHAERANTRRLGLTNAAAGSKQRRNTSARVGRGDVIVCNHTNALEVVWLAHRFSPTFVFTCPESASNGRVLACGKLQAMKRALTMPVVDDKAMTQRLEDLLRRAAGPVVIFVEGTRSNAKAVLDFLPILEHVPLRRANGAPTRVHLVAFRYEYQRFCPCFTAGSALQHVLRSWMYGFHHMHVTHLPANDLPLEELTAATAATLRAKKIEPPTHLTKVQTERMRALLAMMLRTKTVALTVEDFISFNNYWTHVTHGGKRSAAEFTDRKAPHEHAQWSKRT